MRVALVDPSRTVLKAVSRLLEARGHDVLPFMDGREALACVTSDDGVNALITSAAPHSISGVELCWEARLAAGSRRSIYVLMMSSNQDGRNVIEALDCGADDFISKPPVAEELYARLRVAERLSTMQRELIELATTDALTGVLNRRAFFEHANEACARARSGASLAAIMLDVDHFKHVNDMFGHDIGDVVLRDVAAAAARAGDIVGRMGGEEFAILLESKRIGEATTVAERLRAQTETIDPQVMKGKLRVTCSIGVSEWQAGDTIDRLLKRADVALYGAKTSGRNRVAVARGETRRDDAA